MEATTTYSILGEILLNSFTTLWLSTVGFLPQVIGAAAMLVAGLLLAVTFGHLTYRLIAYTKLDVLSERLGIQRELAAFGLPLYFAELLGWLVKWFFIVATLLAVADTLRIPQVAAFMMEVASYIPNVVAAVVMLSVGIVVGRFVAEVVARGVRVSRLVAPAAHLLSRVAEWAIIVFAFLAALVQLGVATSLIQILFTGFVAMVAMAGGLAFGLGGREHAAMLLNAFTREIIRKE